LISWGREFPEVLLQASPWVDMGGLALDGLPYREDVQYIMVGRRDPRDVFMSLWNHYRSGRLRRPCASTT
jgi:hypothetical protein